MNRRNQTHYDNLTFLAACSRSPIATLRMYRLPCVAASPSAHEMNIYSTNAEFLAYMQYKYVTRLMYTICGSSNSALATSMDCLQHSSSLRLAWRTPTTSQRCRFKNFERFSSVDLTYSFRDLLSTPEP